MAKFSRLAGATSQSVTVFIQSSIVSNGGGLTGLVFNTSGLIAYYTFSGANTTAVSIALATLATVTTAYSSGGFKEIDATNQPGLYRLDLPNAALASGKGNSCVVMLTGAANMVPLILEIELTAVDNQSTAFGLSLAKTTNITGFNDIAASAVVSSGAINTSSGAVSTVTTVTNQLTAAAIATGVWQDAVSGDFTTASSIGKALYIANIVPGAAGGHFIAGTNAATTITTGLTTTFTGNLTGSVGSVTGAVGSVTGAVGSVTGAVGSVTAQVTANVTDWNGTATGTIPPDAIFIRSGTAQAGGSTTITLDSGASATNNLYQNETIFIRSGTGIGQSNIIASYVGSTKVATVATAWATNPDATSVFSIIASGPSIASVSGTVNANVMQIAGQTASAAAGVTFPSSIASPTNITAGTITTATNLTNAPTSGDFTSTMKTSLNSATPASVTGAVGSVTGSVGSVVGLTASNLDTTVSSRMATYTQPTGFLAATFPTGTVANTTNITAGTITTATNLTNAPTAGDFTSTMKTSLNAATPASVTGAVGSVTGNVGGSVGSVTAPVAITSNRKKGSTATFEFLMQNVTTGAPQTGLTVASTISKDGGTPASTSNAVTEIGLGQYQIVLTGTEMTANNIFLQFIATGAIIYNLSLQTQP